MAERHTLVITDSEQLRTKLGEMSRQAGGSIVSFNTTNLPSPAIWEAAPMILVCDDAAQLVGTMKDRFPRRDNVLLVGEHTEDVGIWHRAVAIGATHVVMLPDGKSWLEDRIGEVGQLPPAPPVLLISGTPSDGFAFRLFDTEDEALTYADTLDYWWTAKITPND